MEKAGQDCVELNTQKLDQSSVPVLEDPPTASATAVTGLDLNDAFAWKAGRVTLVARFGLRRSAVAALDAAGAP